MGSLQGRPEHPGTPRPPYSTVFFNNSHNPTKLVLQTSNNDVIEIMSNHDIAIVRLEGEGNGLTIYKGCRFEF